MSLTLTTRPKVPSPSVAMILSAIIRKEQKETNGLIDVAGCFLDKW